MYQLEELLCTITTTVWDTVVGRRLDVAAAATDGEAMIEAVVRISGAWDGTVVLACSRRAGRAAAAAMFGRSEDAVTQGELEETLTELVNILGGNLKGIVAGVRALGRPEVAARPVPMSGLAARVHLACDGEPVWVSVLAGAGPSVAA